MKNTRRAQDFFDSKHGKNLAELFNGSFSELAFDNYINQLEENTSCIVFGRIIERIGSDAGVGSKAHSNISVNEYLKLIKKQVEFLYN